MPIAQLIYFQIDGVVEKFYNKKVSAKYNRVSSKPVESMMWKNKF
jgi:dCTP deaminase